MTVKLSTIATRRQENVVGMLEELLEEARGGIIETISFIIERRGESRVGYWCSGTPDVAKTIGQIEFLKRDLLEGMDAGSEIG